MIDVKNATIEEMEARQAAILTEMDGESADLNALQAEAVAIRDELNARKEAATQRAAIRSAVAKGAGTVLDQRKAEKGKMTIEELRSDPRYVDAFANYVKDESRLPELRMLATELVGADVQNATTVPLPKIVQDTIEYVWQRDSQLIDRARLVSYRGIFEIPYEASASPAVIHDEGTTAPAEETLTIDTVTLRPSMIKKWISLTDESLKMKSDSFLQYVYAEVTHQIVLKLENDIVANLVAATNAAGLTSTPVTAAANFASVFAAMAALQVDAQRPVVIMNKALYFNVFMALTDLQQRPIYNIVADNGRPTYYLNGVEVIFNNSLPATAAAGSTYMVVGDMDGYTINAPDGRDVDITTDPYTLATEDRVRVIGKMYVGHGISRPGHFVRVASPN